MRSTIPGNPLDVQNVTLNRCVKLIDLDPKPLPEQIPKVRPDPIPQTLPHLVLPIPLALRRQRQEPHKLPDIRKGVCPRLCAKLPEPGRRELAGHADGGAEGVGEVDCDGAVSVEAGADGVDAVGGAENAGEMEEDGAAVFEVGYDGCFGQARGSCELNITEKNTKN